MKKTAIAALILIPIAATAQSSPVFETLPQCQAAYSEGYVAYGGLVAEYNELLEKAKYCGDQWVSCEDKNSKLRIAYSRALTKLRRLTREARRG